MEPITTVASRLQAVKARIARVAQSVDRQPDEITLLVASKTHPAERVREAWLAGQTIFGENYLQEALAKMPALADLPIEWHFIGPIQSNKTKRIAENFVLGSQCGPSKNCRPLGERPARITAAVANLLTGKCERRGK